MTPIPGAAFARILERNGWNLLRVQGSHHIYGKTGRTERISVPIHGNRPLRIGLLTHLAKVAGLTEADFE